MAISEWTCDQPGPNINLQTGKFETKPSCFQLITGSYFESAHGRCAEFVGFLYTDRVIVKPTGPR
jgi:hypothetical protein